MDEIKVHDMTLVATLSLMGFQFTATEPDAYNTRRTNFIFKNTKDLAKAISDFDAGKVRVEPRRFSNELRHFKTITNKY